MNATELFLEDGNSSGVFFCGKCRCVARSKPQAEQCCQNYQCVKCGKDTGGRSWLVCEPCREDEESKKEADRFEAAKKVTATEWAGWVYLDGTGNDGYSASVEDFWEVWGYDHAESDENPKYVWACKAIHFASADISDIIDRIVDNAYEDFDPDDLNGLDELKKAIEKFNNDNRDIVSYQPDYSTVVLL